MTEQINSTSGNNIGASPVIRPKKSLSIVWFIPVIALLVAGWLAYKAITDKGPVITISFQTAENIEPGKTKVKFKDVEVGVVESIQIGEDLSKVVLTVEMNKEAQPYLTENTKFWLVTARVGATEISGLGTLLGGVYIGMEPSEEGKVINNFKGLEKPPIVTSDMKGKHFYLNAKRLGSLDSGSPIYFRQIKVGRVVDYKLDDKGGNVEIHIFIDSPFDQFVRENTGFWLASGLDLQLTADGLRINTESVVSLLIGGIAFSSIPDDVIKPQAKEYAFFPLYQTRDEAVDDQYTVDELYYVEFTDSVRGLSAGAPVEFRGLRIGSVEDIEAKTDFEKLEFSTLVKVKIEKERLDLEIVDDQTFEDRLANMVAQGFRAQLKTGNLLTGQLFVDLEQFNNPPEASITTFKGLRVVPSVPSASQQITNAIEVITAKLSKMPLEEIGRNLESSLAGVDRLINDPDLQNAPESLARILAQTERMIEELNAETVPEVNTTLREIDNLLQELKAWFSSDSPLYEELDEALKHISSAARSISEVADLLERHPEALLQGKNIGVRK